MNTMRSILLAFTTVVSMSALTADFYDPDDIDPDAPDMLLPSKLNVSCSVEELGISVNGAIRNRRAWNVPQVVEYPLTDKPLQTTSSCQHGKNLVEAELNASPPGESGMCSAMHFIKLRLLVNKRMVLNATFANHCTGWGITSVNAYNRRNPDQLVDLVVCGYWRVQSDVFEKGGSIRSFKCEKYPLNKMYEKGLFFTDGEFRQLTDTGHPSSG